MKLQVINCGGWPEEWEKIATRVARFSLTQLALLDHRGKVVLYLSEHSPEDFGDAFCNGNKYFVEMYLPKPDEFEDSMSCVIHEFVHVWQFARKSLLFSAHHTRFEGDIYPLDTPYEDQLWELEAFNLQMIYWEDFLAKNPDVEKLF